MLWSQEASQRSGALVRLSPPWQFIPNSPSLNLFLLKMRVSSRLFGVIGGLSRGVGGQSTQFRRPQKQRRATRMRAALPLSSRGPADAVNVRLSADLVRGEDPAHGCR